MFGIDPVTAAFIFITLAFVLAAGVIIALNVSSRRGAGPADPAADPPLQSAENEQTGLLVISQGGTVKHANRTLLNWLNLPADGKPNLEHLARRTRPSDQFLAVCAEPGALRSSSTGESSSARAGRVSARWTVTRSSRPAPALARRTPSIWIRDWPRWSR